MYPFFDFDLPAFEKLFFIFSLSYRKKSEKSITKNEKNLKENQNFIVRYIIYDYNR